MKNFIVLLTAGVAVYLLSGVFLYLKQRSYMYFPVRYPPGDEAQLAVARDGQTIYATIVNPGKDRAIIYFGGNAEVVDYSAPLFARLFPEQTVYLVKYRGYGHSTGAPTENGIYGDALAVFDRLREGHSASALIGRSLGSAVAIYVASRRRVSQLALVSPFDSARRLAQRFYPLYPIRLLLKDTHDSLARASAVTADTLVLAGELDAIVPRAHTDRLAAALTSARVRYEILPQLGHNGWSRRADYHRLLSEFLN